MGITYQFHISDRSFEDCRKQIRKYLDLQPYNKNGEIILSLTIEKLALKMADPADLINASISELLRNRFSLPSYQVLERLVKSIRHRVHQEIFDIVENRLKITEQRVLDGLLIYEGKEKSPSSVLKEYPGTAKLTKLKEWMIRWTWITLIISTDPILEGLAFTKIEEFAAQDNAFELSDIKGIEKKGHRHTILLSLLHLKRMDTTDQLTQMVGSL